MKRTTLIIALTVIAFSSIASVGHAITITQNNDATTLINTLVGSGITASGATVTGQAVQFGTFTGGGGSGSIGINSGIVMTSGDVNTIAGANTTGPETVGVGNTSDDDVSTNLGGAGDSDLNTEFGGITTFDAAVLEFTFQFGDGSVGGDLFMNFVFASEEYVDYVGSQFNDVFAFWVDGTNIALTPGSSNPVSINTINNTQNSGLYVNNVTNTNGLPVAGLDVKFDGKTTVMQANALGLAAGTHTMKFAVADTSDGILDAGVFLQGGSFSNEPPVIPVPAALPMLLGGLAGLGLIGWRKRKAA